jgi:hydrogenase expression/formation protein HypE
MPFRNDHINEGTFVLAIKKDDASRAIEVLKTFEPCANATIIAKVTDEYKQKVILNSSWGTKRFLDTPSGELLPRIC